jgi:hypothetical protein
MGSVYFNRPYAEAEIEGYRLVGPPLQDGVEHFAFARTERRYACNRFDDLTPPLVLVTSTESRLDGSQEQIVGERFLDEIDRAASHGVHRSQNITLSRHHDDGKIEMNILEPGLKLKTVHARHSHIDQDTALRR